MLSSTMLTSHNILMVASNSHSKVYGEPERGGKKRVHESFQLVLGRTAEAEYF